MWVIGVLLLLTEGLAGDGEGEWRANTGMHIVPSSPNGVLDLGWRRGALSVELLTDTLDVRLSPEGEHGRRWVALRAEAAIAHLLTDPWVDGAHAPELGFFASYAGAEGGALRYLPRGLYVGGQGMARAYGFRPTPETTTEVPEGRPLLRAELIVGWWTPSAQAYLLAGGQTSLEAIAPHVQLVAKGRGPWTVAPLVEVQAGWAEGQDFLTRTRLGGLSPYGVPLAGAAWAEWWVEDYAALRAGPSITLAPVQVDLVVDAAIFDEGLTAAGLGVLSRTPPEAHRWFVEVYGGYAPWIARQEGVARGAVWLRGGWAWGRADHSPG